MMQSVKSFGINILVFVLAFAGTRIAMNNAEQIGIAEGKRQLIEDCFAAGEGWVLNGDTGHSIACIALGTTKPPIAPEKPDSSPSSPMPDGVHPSHSGEDPQPSREV